MRVCDAAVEVLRETDNPAVMWGDCGLLDMIANRAGMTFPHACSPVVGHRRVLAALRKTPGILIPRLTQTGNGRWVSVFRLPEQEKPLQ